MATLGGRERPIGDAPLPTGFAGKRLVDRLSFLQSLARMWSVAADIVVTDEEEHDSQDRYEDQLDSLRRWAERAKENRVGLLKLLDAVCEYKIAAGGSDKESMRDYDRSRVLRDSLMERISRKR